MSKGFNKYCAEHFWWETKFSPIDAPNTGHKVYRDLFQQIGSHDSIAYANFIPWGSEDMKDLVSRLGNVNKALLRRIIGFADDLNTEIVQALAPKIVAVPRSLGDLGNELSKVGDIGLSLQKATDIKQRLILLPKRTFKFYTTICRRGRLAVRTVFLPHPASLRLSHESKKCVVSEVAAALLENGKS